MDELTKKNLSGIERLLYVMARLRDPEGGCPWDIEQNFSSIAPYTIEEAYEVADAIEHEDMAALKDELGDLLLQVVYHAQMASEAGDFNFQDVVDGISEKMIRRHPHVFGLDDVETAEQQTLAWEEQKARERSEKSGNEDGVLGGVAKGLPALLRAFKLQKRAARVGYDWPDVDGAFEKLREELNELQTEIRSGKIDLELVKDELGDVLFSTVNVGRKLGIDPEAALRHGNTKFEERFHMVESLLGEEELEFDDVDLAKLEELWQEAKRRL